MKTRQSGPDTRREPVLLSVLIVLAGGSASCFAQAPCNPQWLPGQLPGLGGGSPNSLLRWDPDGPAQPKPPVLVAGGGFTSAGGVPAEDVAVWNGSAWSALGNSTNNGFVICLAGLPNGKLFAGGTFTNFSGQPMGYITQWNGSNWSPVGSGVNWFVQAMAAMPNGKIIAAGWFSSPGSLIAEWDGSVWKPLGTGITGSNPGPNVHRLAVTPAGKLLVAGNFTSAGGVPAEDIAVWDGSVWSGLGSGLTGCATCGALAVLPMTNGQIVAGGEFSFAGGSSANRIALWNGTGWQALGTGVNASVESLIESANGEIIIGGNFTSAGGQPANYIAQWNGATWSPVGTGMNQASVAALSHGANGTIVAAGGFTSAGGAPAAGVAVWGCPLAPDCYADCDADGALSIDDFICFQTMFAIGC